MSFFNTFNSFSPFCHSNIIINPTITSANLKLETENNVQISNIYGTFTSLNVIRTNLNTNIVYSIIVSYATNGMTYTDSTVVKNQIYRYQLQPIIGGIYGTIFTISNTISTLVNIYNVLDVSGLVCYYSFENPAVFAGTGPIISQGNLYNKLINNTGLIMYYNYDYMYQQN